LHLFDGQPGKPQLTPLLFEVGGSRNAPMRGLSCTHHRIGLEVPDADIIRKRLSLHSLRCCLHLNQLHNTLVGRIESVTIGWSTGEIVDCTNFDGITMQEGR